MACSGVRIFWDNYIDLDYLASTAVSSEQAAFPVVNAYNSQRRSKVWRSAGYYSVTATNNQIVFRETSGGPDLTANLGVAEYTSISAMCTAIKTALEAVGASTYTVTNSSATGFKFSIVSNGAGGSGVFHLMCSDVAFTAASLLGFAATDLTSAGLTKVADYLRINTDEWIEWDLGIGTNPSSFALIGPRNQPLKFSPSAVIKLQANYTDTWTSPPWETTLTYNDFSLYVTSEAGLADDNYRFWRVSFVDQNPNGFLEAGSLLLGEFFNPTRGRVQFPLEISQEDRTTVLFSEGGQSYSDIKPKTASYSMKWFGLQKADIEEIEDQFARYGTGVPFFAAIDSNPTFTTTAQRRLIFCQFASEPTFTLERPDVWSTSFVLKESL